MRLETPYGLTVMIKCLRSIVPRSALYDTRTIRLAFDSLRVWGDSGGNSDCNDLTRRFRWGGVVEDGDGNDARTSYIEALTASIFV